MLGMVGSVQGSQTRCPWWIGWYTSAWCCCTVASLLVDCCMDSLIFHDMRSMLRVPMHLHVCQLMVISSLLNMEAEMCSQCHRMMCKAKPQLCTEVGGFLATVYTGCMGVSVTCRPQSTLM